MTKQIFKNKRILITGGTGSLGQVLVKRILSNKFNKPKKVIVFSRDEAKQHQMRLEYQNRLNSTDEVIYNNFRQLLEFRIGDIRNFESVASVVKEADIIINAAALKQVPSCEYFPIEAVNTNILGSENIVKAINLYNLPVETVLGVSTDKACKPINVMGMTKALQERIIINANIHNPQTRFICVRYGNVLASRGSVIPLFLDQIKNNGPVTITTDKMTRFLLSLNDAVDMIESAIASAKRGETYIPIARSAKVVDLAKVLIGNRKIKIKYTGLRPGEKINEILISEEELWRTIKRGNYYAIQSFLPEIGKIQEQKLELGHEFSSDIPLMNYKEIGELLIKYKLTPETFVTSDKEILV